ncbi:oxygen-independent coproporphyrinogen III oxidase [Aliikangiella coralliicola]|uniref:Coproporphyrinogen-III oxidase n=1 Tax=Aliikangiella coralliicola TaxID=2592383 RepID=A0A545UDU9_9GAMM|nr:oxygen-independent coproporphyrinogen III oxidase [Aliikangiella coralliicola]TQV87652.1 oxygen-independent coproporphyrinogen III oxidase [Aliikangiella coralliicola]
MTLDAVKLEWDEEILKKYNTSGPRYTSYPTALEFSEDYQLEDYLVCLNNISEDKSLSLYIHIPFCQNICYYCACNKVITKDRSKSDRYVEYLIKEIQLVAAQSKAKTLRQVHWGGGTPTYLTMQQISAVMAAIRENFELPDTKALVGPSAEVSIEVDPRALALEDIKTLAELGFNRMSFGVQDFDPKVQQAINRAQPFEMTREMVDEARNQGFKSINIDLIYGLPHQTTETFQPTLEKIIEISPDRISLFNYAHLPHRFKPQRRINRDDLPSPTEKLAILEYSINTLQQAGYLYIGMDHFAKPDDELAIAQQNACLHRNFQGYTTHEEYELIGVGVSSIGSLGGQYHQNVRDLDSYYMALDKDELPSWRGVGMSVDDKIRKTVIFELICHFEVFKQAIEESFDLEFDRYFENELKLLRPFINDGLLVINDESIKVTNKGRLLIRNICMMFDAYLNELQVLQSYSKVI